MSDQAIYNMILIVAVTMMVFFTKRLYERSEEYRKLLRFKRFYMKAILEPVSEYTGNKVGHEEFITTMKASTEHYIERWEEEKLSYYFYLPTVFDAKTSFTLNNFISKRKRIINSVIF